MDRFLVVFFGKLPYSNVFIDTVLTVVFACAQKKVLFLYILYILVDEKT